MNIISYNVRGLGRGIKWPAIRRLVNNHHIDMLCIQETKKEIIERSMCQALWGDSDVKWEQMSSSRCLWREVFLLEPPSQRDNIGVLLGELCFVIKLFLS